MPVACFIHQVMQLLQSIAEAAQNVAESLQSADSSCSDSWLAWFFGSNIDYNASRLIAWFVVCAMFVIASMMLLTGSGLDWLIRLIAGIDKLAFLCLTLNDT